MRTPTVLLIAAVAMAGTGCMSDMHPSPHGQTFTYDCSGLGHGWGDCAEKADAQCGAHNYAVVSREGEAEGTHEDRNTQMKRTLVVSCK